MPKIYLGMPSGDGKIPLSMVTNLLAMQKLSKYEINVSFVGRSDISHARNQIIKDFLTTDCTHLFFYDDDNCMEDVRMIDKMIEAKKPVITALIPSRTPVDTGEHYLCIFGERYKDTGEHEYVQYKKMPKTQGIIPIANCGMGCVLIEREVVQLVADEFDRPCEMKMVWYYDGGEEGWIRDERMDYAKIKDGVLRFKRYISEDLLFFERAREFGVTLWADTSIHCSHIGDNNLITVKKHIGL